MTLLEIVQRVLSAIDAENVNSVDETIESAQIVELVNMVYDRLMEYPFHFSQKTDVLELTATYYKLKPKTKVTAINWFKYNKKDVVFMEPKEFIDMIDARDVSLSNVDADGYINDKDPQYWTTFDDEYIWVDSYNGQLVSAYSIISYYEDIDKLINDTDEPLIPKKFHNVLVDGVLAEAFRTLKADENSSSIYDGKHMRGKIRMKRWARLLNGEESTYNGDYSRKQVGIKINTVRTVTDA